MVAMKVVSIVGMAGAGKSEVARVFEQKGFTRIRFGDVTDEEIRKRGLELTEKNERYIRELLRQEYGMAAYAKLNLPKIDAALKSGDVVIDGLYSWEEYIFLKNHYRGNFCVVAVWAPSRTRYARLTRRVNRRLTPEEAASRDKAELENTNKGGPIAMADFTIINESSLKNLQKETERVIARLRNEKADQTGY
jgi:dephospho-CoA kinase